MDTPEGAVNIMNLGKFNHVSAKLGNMRKAQSFTVYPHKADNGKIIVQSDKSIGIFDPETRRGFLNTKGCYFAHLSASLGAVAYQFPEDFVKQCRAIVEK